MLLVGSQFCELLLPDDWRLGYNKEVTDRYAG